jgi:hypothetical protein
MMRSIVPWLTPPLLLAGFVALALTQVGCDDEQCALECSTVELLTGPSLEQCIRECNELFPDL